MTYKGLNLKLPYKSLFLPIIVCAKCNCAGKNEQTFDHCTKSNYSIQGTRVKMQQQVAKKACLYHWTIFAWWCCIFHILPQSENLHCLFYLARIRLEVNVWVFYRFKQPQLNPETKWKNANVKVWLLCFVWE